MTAILKPKRESKSLHSLAKKVACALIFGTVGLKFPERHRRKGALWTAAELKLLGSESDKAVAKRISRTVVSVKAKRRLLGIPIIGSKPPYWTPEKDRLLGTAPDPEIARRLDRTVSVVYNRRERLNIPAYGKRRTSDGQ